MEQYTGQSSESDAMDLEVPHAAYPGNLGLMRRAAFPGYPRRSSPHLQRHSGLGVRGAAVDNGARQAGGWPTLVRLAGWSSAKAAFQPYDVIRHATIRNDLPLLLCTWRCWLRDLRLCLHALGLIGSPRYEAQLPWASGRDLYARLCFRRCIVFGTFSVLWVDSPYPPKAASLDRPYLSWHRRGRRWDLGLVHVRACVRRPRLKAWFCLLGHCLDLHRPSGVASDSVRSSTRAS